jgi:ribosome-associated protein
MAKSAGERTSDRAPRKRTARAKTASDGTSAAAPKSKRTAGRVLKEPKSSTPKTPRKRPAKKSAETPEVQNVIREQALQAAHFALEKKALNVRMLDLTKITSMTDFFVVCHGESDPQVKAIAENVIARMRDDKGVSPWRSEGWDALQWVLIDFVDFVVHVFQSESRQYYNLERLWADAPAITVEDTAAPAATRTKRKTAASDKSAEPETQEGAGGVRVISDFNPVEKKKRTRIKPADEDNEE